MDIHTCGDEAQETVVRAFAAAQRENPKPWLRHRVHHAYFPTPAALAAMAEAGIPAVVSSPFLTNLGEGFVNSVGSERASRAMPMRTYLNAGVPLAGSSDSYITDYNPWVGMHAAVNRTTATGRDLGKETEALTPRKRSAPIPSAARTSPVARTGRARSSRQAGRSGRARPRSAGHRLRTSSISETDRDHAGRGVGLPRRTCKGQPNP